MQYRPASSKDPPLLPANLLQQQRVTSATPFKSLIDDVNFPALQVRPLPPSPTSSKLRPTRKSPSTPSAVQYRTVAHLVKDAYRWIVYCCANCGTGTYTHVHVYALTLLTNVASELACCGAQASLEREDLWREVALLERLIYKNRSQHRSSIHFRRLLEVRAGGPPK